MGSQVMSAPTYFVHLATMKIHTLSRVDHQMTAAAARAKVVAGTLSQQLHAPPVKLIPVETTPRTPSTKRCTTSRAKHLKAAPVLPEQLEGAAFFP